MAWFKKTRKPIASTAEKSSRVPEGLWIKCPGCTQIIYNKDLDKNQQVCPKCRRALFGLSQGALWGAHLNAREIPDAAGSPVQRLD